MYCPRCGQQQISDQTKFCSRCGLQLDLVAELIAHGGFLPQLNELYQAKAGLFTRKNGVIAAILWFIFFVMMLPAFFGLAGIKEASAASALFGVFTSLMILIVSLAYLPRTRKAIELPGTNVHSAVPAGLHGNVGVGALPPKQSQPASSYIPPEGALRANAADLSRPGSVTEDTTRLLKKEEE